MYVYVYGWVHVCVLFCIGMPMGGGRAAAGLAIIHVRMYICNIHIHNYIYIYNIIYRCVYACMRVGRYR